MTRKTVKTKAIVDNLVEQLRMGMPLRTAARWNGIGEATIRDWIKADDADAKRLREASQRVPKRALQIIAEKIDKDEREDLAQWWLERRVPEFRRVNGAPEPILDLWDELDEDSKDKVRSIIVEGLAPKEKAKA